jgi:hypothetical protein
MSLNDPICTLCGNIVINLMNLVQVCLKILIIVVFTLGFSYILIFPPYICFFSDDNHGFLLCSGLMIIWGGILMSSVVPALLVTCDKIRNLQIETSHYNDFLNRFVETSRYTIQIYFIIILNLMIGMLVILLALPFYYVITDGCVDMFCNIALAEILSLSVISLAVLWIIYRKEPIQDIVTV